MPKISTFMYCEGSMNEILPNGQQRIHIVSPQHFFAPQFIPGTLSFSVVFGILEIDTTLPHDLRFFLKSPSGESIVDPGLINIPVNTTPDVMSMPEDMRGFIVNLSFQNVILRDEGEFFSEIYLDDEKIGRYPIKVKGRELLK